LTITDAIVMDAPAGPGTLRVRLLGPYRRWCPRPTGIDLGHHLSRRNVIVNRYESTIAR